MKSLFVLFITRKLRKEVYFSYYSFDTKDNEWLFDLDAKTDWFSDGVVGDNETGYPNLIVPNIVHYVLLDYKQIDFVHYLSLKSVFSVQKPDKVIIHCNCDELEGNYWNKLKNEIKDFENIVIIRKVEKSGIIFGFKFKNVWHESDVIRIKALMEFGGIYLDRDVIVIKSLDPLRKFEMTIDYQFLGTHREMANEVQIAHKRARFLRLYLQTYEKYNGTQRDWNSGQYPVERIINKYPHLVHSMNRQFGVSSDRMCSILYLKNTNDWRKKYFTVHLLMKGNSINHIIRCFPKQMKPSIMDFNEENVKKLKTTFGQIARLILYNTTDIIN